MKSEILAKLRNILVKLYPDEASMRRISHDGGLDLSRVTLNSSATNNWHSILNEAENVGRVDALLTAVLQEYGSNQALLDAYQAYHQVASQPTPNDDQRPTLNTSGGTAVGNNVQTGGDFIGRDQINFIVPLGSWKEIQSLLLKDGINANAIKASVEQFQTFDWSKAEQAYLEKVIKLYDRVRILGSSMDVPLGKLFTQVYILDKPTARQRYDIDELRWSYDHLGFYERSEQRIDGLELARTKENLFILGKPGAGKTTFLKYIMIQAARKQLPCIPIFVSLNQWADSRWGKGDDATLLPFLVEQFDICNFPDANLFIDCLLRGGRALVLFDGLDEVKQENGQRRCLTQLLQNFARKYDKSQYLITCRVAASDYAFAGFADVEIADYTPSQVREYAHKWFGEQTKKFNAFIAELEKTENQGLAELCNTPLLLSLLCLTFDNVMRFPPSRAELYEDALETLLRKWDSSRQIQRDEIYRTLSYKRKLQLLMRIAKPSFEEGEIFFRQRELENWILDYLMTLPDAPPVDSLDPTAILKAIEAQHSILVERAHCIYSFSHLTLQEYLTARALSENRYRDVTGKLVYNHLTDKRWREVFLLTASLLDDADEFVTAMSHAISTLIITTPRLLNILRWAEERSYQVCLPEEQRVSIRLAYIVLALALELDFESTLMFGGDRDLAHTLELDVTITNACTRAFEIEISLARERSHTLIIARDLALVRNLARVTTPLVGFDYGLYYAWIYATLFASESFDLTDRDCRITIQQLPNLVSLIAEFASEAGLANLAQQLTTANMLSANISRQGWQHCANNLLTIMREQRDLGREWHLDTEDIDKLNDYFYATELLVQCLKISAVSDRQAVRDGLLLLPNTNKNTEC